MDALPSLWGSDHFSTAVISRLFGTKQLSLIFRIRSFLSHHFSVHDF